MDDDDVGMAESGGGLGLLDKQLLALRIGNPVRRQDLDGYRRLKVGVDGFIDDAHPAFADLLGDSEMEWGLADRSLLFTAQAEATRLFNLG